jgi:hypothetical protein
MQPGAVEIVCAREGCEVVFKDHPSQHRKYHSNECKHLARRSRREFVCKGCGITYEKALSVSSAYHSGGCREDHRAKLAAEQIALEAAASVPIVIPEPDPAIVATRDVRSYLVGVFDGEGCITAGFARDGSTYLVASVTMASETIVRLFHGYYQCGGVTCRSKLSAGGLRLWTWQVFGGSSRPVLADIAALGLEKQRQAQIASALAANMAQYTTNRDGFSPLRDGRRLLPQERAERVAIINALRALNGARNRFTATVVDPLAT